MVTKNKLCLLLAWVLAINVYGQSDYLVVKVINSSSYPIGGQGASGNTTSNIALNAIFTEFGVQVFKPKYTAAYRVDAPATCAPLKSYYTIICNNADSLAKRLKLCNQSGLSEIKVLDGFKLAHTPNDFNLKIGEDPNLNWYLTKIQANEAWDISHSNPNVKIAILDWGFDVGHQDFAGKIAYTQNPGYGTNQEHGTACAGLAAGKTNDNLGLSSIGYDASLMFYLLDGGNSILQAALDGADIICISLITTDNSSAEQFAIDQAYALGAFIVAGAGNGRSVDSDPDNDIMYPASYNHVFSVTGVYSNDAHSSDGGTQSTHQHNTMVDLAAPGYHLWHAMPNNGYDQGDGTSFSAPIVAGVAALIKGANPCLTNDEIELVLKQSSDDIYSVLDNHKFLGKLGAGRLNAFKAVQLAKNWGDLTVTNQVNINQGGTYGTIVVKKGGSLTISNSTIMMAKGGKIIVEAGGALYLNSSALKSNTGCVPTPYKWGGIIVEGNPNLPQNKTNQGFLSISNSTIQDALNAVSTVSKDALNNAIWSKSGGAIIKGANSIFRNNARHLEFTSYHSRSSTGVEVNNQSAFTGCKFFVDDNKIISIGNKVMITLWDVKGIRFSGCEFVNDYNTYGNDKGKGILAVEAEIIVENNKGVSGSRGLFSNLEYGIDATFNPNSSKVLLVNNTNFNKNRYGICLKEGLSSSIYRNSFDLRNTTFNKAYRPVGLQSLWASGFRLSENTFVESFPDVVNPTYNVRYGSEIRNSDKVSGATPYTLGKYTLNQHTNIAYGLRTEYENGYLQVNCNGFVNGFEDISLNLVSSGSAKPKFGNCNNNPIDRNNTFNGGAASGFGDANIFNYVFSGPPSIDYVIKAGEPFRPTLGSNVNILDCNGIKVVSLAQCSKLFSPEPGLGDGVILPWEPKDKRTEYFLLKQTLPQYPVDNLPFPSKEYDIHAKLTELRSDILYDYHNLMLFKDEQSETYAQLVSFLERDGTTESKKTLATLYYNYGFFTKTTDIINTLNTTNAEHKSFVDYYRVLLQLQAQQKNIFQMDEQQEMQMRSIALGTTAVAVSAQGIITLVYGDRFDVIPWHSDDRNAPNKATNGNGVDVISQPNYTLWVYPNPALKSVSPFINIKYSIVNGYSTGSCRLVNQWGEAVAAQSVTGQTGDIAMNIETLPTGIYAVQLVVNGVVVTTKTINLQ